MAIGSLAVDDDDPGAVAVRASGSSLRSSGIGGTIAD
jgi:hypothetical protein